VVALDVSLITYCHVCDVAIPDALLKLGQYTCRLVNRIAYFEETLFNWLI
jgi:hypothetical protein